MVRRIGQARAGYRQLADNERRSHARQLLASGRLSRSEVADELGLADVASFSRAKRRWRRDGLHLSGRGLRPSARRRRLAATQGDGLVPTGPTALELDIIIPARGETHTLPFCLQALLCDGAGLALRVIVVANGPDCEPTAQGAARFAEAFAQAGHDLRVLETPRPGKVAALNLGDPARRACPVIYLDADAIILPGTLSVIARRLSETEAPRLVCPALQVVRPDGWLARQYSAVWSELPAVRSDVMGSGCYGVNLAGRARWGAFPDLLSDDGFVCSRFAPSERLRLADAGIFFALLEGWDLIAARRRWRRGALELRRLPPTAPADPAMIRAHGRRMRREAISTLLTPRLWPGVPAYLAVTLLGRVGLRPRPKAPGGAFGDWLPVRGAPQPSAPARRPQVLAVLPAGENELGQAQAPAPLESQWSDLSRAVPSGRDPTAAINRAVKTGPESDFILFCASGVTPGLSSIDTLLALAMRYPTRGLYGGQRLGTTGRLHSGGGGGGPSLSRALSFALGGGPPWGDAPGEPQGHGPQGGPTDTRETLVLPAGMFLISSDLWGRLGGFDDRFQGWDAQVDLSMRARCLGARPMLTDRATYVWRAPVGAPAERPQTLLADHVTLLRRYLPGGRATAACGALVAGVAVRALLERLRRGRLSGWAAAWSSRKHWMAGRR